MPYPFQMIGYADQVYTYDKMIVADECYSHRRSPLLTFSYDRLMQEMANEELTSVTLKNTSVIKQALSFSTKYGAKEIARNVEALGKIGISASSAVSAVYNEQPLPPVATALVASAGKEERLEAIRRFISQQIDSVLNDFPIK